LTLYGLARLSAKAAAALSLHPRLLLADEMETRIRKARTKASKSPPLQAASPPDAARTPPWQSQSASDSAPQPKREGPALPTESRKHSAEPVVREFTAESFRAALKRFEGNQLLLDSIVRLAPDTAAVLLEHDAAHLSLGGLKQITPEVAAILARRGGSLDLHGLSELPPEVASALAHHSGWLALDGLQELSAEAAAAIVTHEHSLSLCGLRAISDDVAERLASYRGILTLNQNIDVSTAARQMLTSGCATIRFS
jgi:hypothetical protein